MRQFFTLLLCLGFGSEPVSAEPLPILDAEIRKDWAAVGHVNKGGYNKRAQCTGTLVGPDLVLTAAHCIGGPNGWLAKVEDVHFLAGWERGEFVHHGRAHSVRTHPAYVPSSGLVKTGYDVAFVQLTEAVPKDKVAPVPVTQTPSDDGNFAILGYQTWRPHLIGGRFDCAHRLNEATIFGVGCEVVGGNSGSPVLRDIDGAWTIAGVVAARSQINDEDIAYIARLNQWIFDEIDASYDRHPD